MTTDPNYKPWTNINEDGEVYDQHATLEAAQAVQAQFPNDTIIDARTGQAVEV